MAQVRVTWSENGMLHNKVINGVMTLADATFIAALSVEDPTNAKLADAVFVD